ncbi:MAG: hypothetical protein KUG78_08405 [Kangiellaceae bacterium]|nr:hypothetical protein [Kangiellaceae bacterium]
MSEKIVNIHKNKEPEWYEPENATPREQCPCCDYISLAERGNYLICLICFWEDDGGDVCELDYPSGPNHMTLREGRANFKRIGACDENMKKHVLAESERNDFEYKPRKL